MNNTSQSIRVGLFFLLGLALAWITFESLNGGGFTFRKKGYTLVAGFANLKGLKTGDEIRMAGVKVGAVELTRLASNRVEAVLNINDGTQIPADAVASVEQSSLLGSNYLGITFGTPGGPLLRDKDEIKTKATVDMSEVISQLGALGSKLEQVAEGVSKALGGGESGSASLFTKLDRLVTDNGPKLTETLSNLQDFSARIKAGEGTLGRFINDPKMHDELLATVNEFKQAATDARTFMSDAKLIVADVKSGKGTLGLLLYDEPTASSLKVSLNNLREVSAKLNSNQGTLGKLIADDSLYLGVQSTLVKVDRAIDGLGEQGPITAVGVAAQSLY